MKKALVAVAIIAALSSCASFGSYSSSMPDLFLGKIQLALENYGSRTGTYTKGIYANFRSKDTRAYLSKSSPFPIRAASGSPLTRRSFLSREVT
jgi:hypothetical protein